jgi:hypothetical protein
VSELVEPEFIVVVSVATELESVAAPEPPLPPHAANAPNINIINSFFIVSLFIVIVDLRVNTVKEER